MTPPYRNAEDSRLNVLTLHSIEILKLSPEQRGWVHPVRCGSRVLPGCRSSVMVHKVRAFIAWKHTDFPARGKRPQVFRYGIEGRRPGPCCGSRVVVQVVFPTLAVDPPFPSSRKRIKIVIVRCACCAIGRWTDPCCCKRVVVKVVCAPFAVQSFLPAHRKWLFGVVNNDFRAYSLSSIVGS